MTSSIVWMEEGTWQALKMLSSQFPVLKTSLRSGLTHQLPQTSAYKGCVNAVKFSTTIWLFIMLL